MSKLKLEKHIRHDVGRLRLRSTWTIYIHNDGCLLPTTGIDKAVDSVIIKRARLVGRRVKS